MLARSTAEAAQLVAHLSVGACGRLHVLVLSLACLQLGLELPGVIVQRHWRRRNRSREQNERIFFVEERAPGGSNGTGS